MFIRLNIGSECVVTLLTPCRPQDAVHWEAIQELHLSK
jgi:hypothetical protein